MKSVFVFLSCIFFLNFLQAQEQLIHIKKQLDTIGFGTQADALLSNFCALTSSTTLDTDRAYCLAKRSLYQLNRSETKASLKNSTKAIALYKSLKLSKAFVATCIIKARAFEGLNQKDSAQFYYQFALEKATVFDNQFESNYRFGVYHLDQNNFKQASLYLEQALKWATANNDQVKIAKVRYRLGNISFLMKAYDKANEKLFEALTSLQKHKAPKIDIAHTFFLIGNNFFFTQDWEKAKMYYLKALSIYEKTNTIRSIAYTLSAIGNCYTYLEKYSNAHIYLDKAIALQHRKGFKNHLATTYGRKVILFFRTKELEKSIEYSKKVIDLNKELKRNKQVYIGYHNLGFLYDTIGKNKQAYKAMLTAFRYKDTVLKNDYFDKLSTIETKFNLQEKENKILQLSNKTLQQEAALVESRNMLFIVLILMGLVLGTGYFFWTRRKHQHQLALLENTVKASEAEKSRIGKELHDSIANNIMKLVNDSEKGPVQFSHKLLETYHNIRNLSHQLDNSPQHGELFLDRVLDCIPESRPKQKFHFSLHPRNLQIDEPKGTHLFRILQELIANNLKHAKATQTQIELVLEKRQLNLDYQDNGVGVNPLKKGKGLKNIEDRIQLMKGTLAYKTSKSKGFKLTISIPHS